MFAKICSLLNWRSVQSAFGTRAVVAAWHIRDTSDASVYSLYTDSYTDRLMPWYIDTIQRAHGGGIQSAIEDQQNEQPLLKLPFWPAIILCFEVNEPKQLLFPFVEEDVCRWIHTFGKHLLTSYYCLCEYFSPAICSLFWKSAELVAAKKLRAMFFAEHTVGLHSLIKEASSVYLPPPSSIVFCCVCTRYP